MFTYYSKTKSTQRFLINSLTLMLLEIAAVFAPKLADLVVAAVSVKIALLQDFVVMT
jgi:hypothetical protein